MSTPSRAAVSVAKPSGDEPWTVLQMVRWSGAYLTEKGVERGRLDGELLLAEALGLSRLDLYLQHDRPLSTDELASFKPLLLRRARREPLQYILGHTAFRELDLRTDQRALVPRPETESLVQEVLDWANVRANGLVGAGLTALDVGTGTGCVALSLAREGPFDSVVATDVSPDALELARENTSRTGLGEVVELLEGDLYEPVAARRFDLVVSNPPYVMEPERPALEPEVRVWEPALALFAGLDGLDVLRGLVAGAAAHLAEGGLLALETGPDQTAEVTGLVSAVGAFDEPWVRRDLAGRPRIVLAQLRGEPPRQRDVKNGSGP